MDQRTSDVEADLKNILQTRLALADKLQLLERRVEESVMGTRTAALDIITHAKNTAVDFVESTTAQLNPVTQAQRRPWLLVGGAIAVGLLAGWFDQRRKSSGRYTYAPPQAHPAEVMPSEGRAEPRPGVYPFYPADEQLGHERARQSPGPGGRIKETAARTLNELSSVWGDVAGELSKERARLQGAAFEAGRTFLHELAHIAVQSVIDSLGRRPGPRVSELSAGAPRPEAPATQTRPRAAA
jgi:hypothetical protein